MTTPIPKAADQTVEQIMSTAQEFASAWPLFGSRFDGGAMLGDAEKVKDRLRALVEALAVDAERGRWIIEHAVMIDASVPGMLTMVMASAAEGAIKADAVAAIDTARTPLTTQGAVDMMGSEENKS